MVTLRKSPSGPEAFIDGTFNLGGTVRVEEDGNLEGVPGTLPGQLWFWDGTLWKPTTAAPAHGQIAEWNASTRQWQFLSARILLRQTFINVAGAGNHNCVPQATHAETTCCGGGGAGGGANAALGQASVGGGASAGGTTSVLLDLVAGGSLVIPYVIGAGGLGVVGTSGNNGNDSSFTYNGVTYTGGRGLGSVASTSGTTLQLIGCVQGGVATNGTRNVPGGPPTPGIRETATSGVGGNGGSSPLAFGPAGASSAIGLSASADGIDAILGCGGSGAVNFNDAPAPGNRGGHGGTGWLLVSEFRIVI